MEYIVNNDIGTIKLPKTFRDYDCSVKLGEIKTKLRSKNRPRKVIIDMSITEWADPLPLLSLGALLYTISEYNTKVTINLGSPSSNDHRVFLKFLSTQGFIKAYGKFSEFQWNKGDYPSDQISEILKKFHLPINYHNADCIFADFIGVNDFRNDNERKKLNKKVEELVKEAKKRLIDISYGRDYLIRDRLLHKIRKIIYELLSNVIEHAYPEEYDRQPLKGYAGIYVRMRSGLPNNKGEAQKWRDLNKKEQVETNCPAIKAYTLNPYIPWIEIFICDVGVGLLANLEKWKVPSELPDVKNTIERLISNLRKGEKSDALRILAKHILFSQPFSSVDFKDPPETRTFVTGLLHLGLMLQQDNDFTRIYTRGEWIGSHHPWGTKNWLPNTLHTIPTTVN